MQDSQLKFPLFFILLDTGNFPLNETYPDEVSGLSNIDVSNSVSLRRTYESGVKMFKQN